MFAQLGNIVFEGIKGFEAFAHKLEASYAQHALITGKPKIERTGTALDELDITINLHSAFTVPEDDIKALDAARINGDILTLTLGTGTVVSDFVIVSIENKLQKTDKNGAIVGVTLELKLLECVTADKFAQQQKAAKNNAFAVGDVPTRTITALPASPMAAMQISNNVKQAGTQVNKAKQLVDKLKKGIAQVDKTAKQVTKAITTANDKLTAAREMVLNNSTINGLATDLAASLDATTALGNNVLATAAPLVSVANLDVNLGKMSEQLNITNTKASPVLNLAALRKFI